MFNRKMFTAVHALLTRFKHIKGSKEGYLLGQNTARRLFIRTKHSMRIFGVIPFRKLQNDT